MTSVMDVVLGAANAKGPRPYFFKDPDVERVLNITMALAGELAVARERIDTLERLLEQKGVVQQNEIENFEPDSEVTSARMKWNDEYLARVLRIVHQEIARLEAEPEPTS